MDLRFVLILQVLLRQMLKSNPKTIKSAFLNNFNCSKYTCGRIFHAMKTITSTTIESANVFSEDFTQY